MPCINWSVIFARASPHKNYLLCGYCKRMSQIRTFIILTKLAINNRILKMELIRVEFSWKQDSIRWHSSWLQFLEESRGIQIANCSKGRKKDGTRMVLLGRPDVSAARYELFRLLLCCWQPFWTTDSQHWPTHGFQTWKPKFSVNLCVL